MHFFYLSVNVFSTKVLIGDTIFTSPNGDGTAILRGHPSHAKVSPLAVQRKYLHFSVILRPWVLIRSQESNARPPVLQSNALPPELILPRSKFIFENNLHSEETLFLVDLIRFVSLNLYFLAICPRLLCFSSYNQINKQPENLYVNCS